jgi:glycerophosphoryl diester phosphodiesterase
MSAPSQYPFIFGHRGASGYAPENTLSALEKALTSGVKAIEVDAMITADQHVIIFHDHKLDRCTSGQGTVRHSRWADIAELDAGTWYNPGFSNQRVTHLNQLIQLINEYPEVIVNIEIKPWFNNALTTTRLLVSTLKQQLINPYRLIFSSFNMMALTALLRYWPSAYRAMNIDSRVPGAMLLAKSLGCKAIHINQTEVTENFVKQCHRMNLAVRCYTVNDPSRARQLLAMNIDGIFTDVPLDILDAIR